MYGPCKLSLMKLISSCEPNWFAEVVTEKDSCRIASPWLLRPWRLGPSFVLENSSAFTSLDWRTATVESTNTAAWSSDCQIENKKQGLTKPSLAPHLSLMRSALSIVSGYFSWHLWRSCIAVSLAPKLWGIAGQSRGLSHFSLTSITFQLPHLKLPTSGCHEIRDKQMW